MLEVLIILKAVHERGDFASLKTARLMFLLREDHEDMFLDFFGSEFREG
jgi:hypothetical protein